MKVLIFDSGTIINLSMNGLLYILEELKKKFDGKFIITEAVKQEIFDRPYNIPRFELEALEIKKLIDLKVLEPPETLGIKESLLKNKINQLMNAANNAVEAEGKRITIVSEAEISCLSLSSELENRKIENLIAIDERTTRILSEKPENLEKIMTKKLNKKVKIDFGALKIFSNFKFIRSSEIGYVAYKTGVLRVSGAKALEAVLYATKYKGAAISFEEIEQLKKMG